MFAFLTSIPGRVLRFAAGFLITVTAAFFHPIVALVLITVGSAMAVTALAGECYLETLVRGRASRPAAVRTAPVH